MPYVSHMACPFSPHISSVPSVLSIAALLGVATCSYLLGAMWSGAQSQQYATAAAAVRTTWRPQPLIAGGRVVPARGGGR